MLLYLLLLPFLALSLPNSQRLDRARIASVEVQVEAMTAGNSPGVAIGIVQEGEVVYETYFGFADLEHEIEVGPATRFNIASNAKQFTALCILELEREGALDLQEDIREYLPELFPEQEASITIAQLIDHSSGIRDVYDLWALQGKTWWERFLGNGDAFELLAAQRDLNFDPGTDHQYSNSNYLLLAEIVQRVSGTSFDEYADSLFRRLGLRETSFLTNYMEVIPGRAQPYGHWGGWKRYPTITNLHGDGALFTTLRDQLRWERIIQSGGASGFSSELLAASQSTLPDHGIDAYGCGVCFGRYRGFEYQFHEGNTGAYNATFVRFPAERLAVVVMSNNGSISTHDLARDYAASILDATEDVPSPSLPADSVANAPEPESLPRNYPASIEGSFWNEETETEIRILHERGAEYRIIKNGRDRKGTLISKDLLRERSYAIHIERDERGRTRGLRVDRDRIRNVRFAKRSK